MAASTNRLCEHCKAFEFKESSFARHFETKIVGGEEQLSSKSDPYLWVPYARTDTLPELPSLRLDAELGCNSCGLLRDLIMKRFNDMSDLDTIEINIRRVEHWWLDGLHGLFIKLIDFNGSRSKEISLEVYTDNEKCAHWLQIDNRDSLEEILSDEGISTINGWIRNCTHYEECTSLPTRLIEVGGRPGLQNPRLVLTEDHAPLVPSADTWRYIALSYVWGSEPPTTTTKESLSARTTEIDFATLPQHFKDTILLSRRLGINYVWIDSLCIIQDDLDDWEKESAEMFNIYRQAYVTFIALNGESCHDGFLRRVPQPCAVIPYTLPSGITVNYGLREHKAGDERLLDEIRASKWGTRGWTFQEELFSSRKLYFGQTMFFECSEDHKQEITRTCYRPQSRNYKAAFQDHTGAPYINYTEFWDGKVMQYASRQFTKPADRLPALSSWAKFIANKTNDEYLAGLWKRDLLRELHWINYKPDLSLDEFKRKLKKPGEPEYEAPSWSWCRWTSAASDFMQMLGWRPHHIVPMCRIIEAKTEVQGKNPFGRVSDGHLIISGILLAFPFKPYDLVLKSDWMSNDGELESGDFYLLLLYRNEPALFFESTGLILLRTEIEGQYQRAGVFWERAKEGGPISIFDGSEHCTIRII